MKKLIVKEEVVPKLSDVEYLQSLPPNTVGGHLGNLFKNWSIEELYDKRYLEEKKMKNLLFKVNLLQNLELIYQDIYFLTHDLFHILFRYDTSIFGEALIQKITCKAVKN